MPDQSPLAAKPVVAFSRRRAWLLAASVVLLLLAVVATNNFLYFAWLTASPPVATPTGSREMTAEETMRATRLASLWLAIGAALFVGAIASALWWNRYRSRTR